MVQNFPIWAVLKGTVKNMAEEKNEAAEQAAQPAAEAATPSRVSPG